MKIVKDNLEKLAINRVNIKEILNSNNVKVSDEVIDVLTGYATYSDIVTEDTIKQQLNKQNIIDRANNKNALEQMIFDNFGVFYFSCYKNLLKLKMDKQYLFRFIYLCTYLNYDNKIVFGNAKGDRKLALEKDLQEILRLSERETRNTKNELIKSKLITINTDKTITIDKKYAVKGKIDKRKLKGSVRTMEKGIQELYNRAKATEHKKLALLIELLPYLNFRHNVLCHNPQETDIKEIKAITLSELAKILNTNQTRLKRELFDITVNDELTIAITETKQGKFIYVNPKVYYKGDDLESLRALINIFKLTVK